MSEILAPPVVQLTARIAAVAGVIAAGSLYARALLVTPMPWPWLFGLVWLAFVIATVLAARRWPYRPLLIWVMSVVFLFVAFWIGRTFLGWAP